MLTHWPVYLLLLGVVFYILLSGMMPFTADPAGEIRTLNGEYSFPDTAFNTVSSAAKDLIRRMLQIEPGNRITAAEILQHPWMKRKSASTTRLKPRSANYYVDDGSYGYTNNDKQALHAVGSDAHYGLYEAEKEDEEEEEELDDDVDITKNLPSLRLYYAASAAPSPEKDAVLGKRQQQQQSQLQTQSSSLLGEEAAAMVMTEEELTSQQIFQLQLPSESQQQAQQQAQESMIIAPPPATTPKAE